MIKRESKLLITFDTTHDAIAMEATCRKKGIPGRLVPVPSYIAAGCGLALCTNPDMADQIEEHVKSEEISYKDFVHCTI